METLQRTANRGSVSTGYDISNSLKLEHDNDEQLERASSDGNRRTWTLSCWFKMSDIDADYGYVLQHFGVNNQATRILVDPGNNFQLQVDLCDTGTDLYRTYTTAEFRDCAAWYHVVVAVDTTQGTDSNRLKIYINGNQVTSFSQVQYPTQNLDTLANVDGYGNEAIATFPWAGSTYDGMFSGYIAEHILVDGQQLAASDFGEFDDDAPQIWKPKDPSSITFGTNGHWLKFDSSGSLGADSSGNSNNYTLDALTAADQATDTCTNNFCTMNQLWDNSYTDFTEGNTNVDTTGSGWISMASTFAVKKGKWYWEFKTDSGNAFVGIVDTEEQYIPRSTGGYFFGYNDDSSTNSIGLYSANGQVYNSPGGSPDAAGFNTSNIVGVAVDMDNRRLYYSIDGTYAGSMDPAAGTGGVTIPSDWNSEHIYMGFSGFNGSYAVNFGGYTTISISSAESDGNNYGNFEYAPPSGYYSLCTKNLAEYG